MNCLSWNDNKYQVINLAFDGSHGCCCCGWNCRHHWWRHLQTSFLIFSSLNIVIILFYHNTLWTFHCIYSHGFPIKRFQVYLSPMNYMSFTIARVVHILTWASSSITEIVSCNVMKALDFAVNEVLSLFYVYVLYVYGTAIFFSLIITHLQLIKRNEKTVQTVVWLFVLILFQQFYQCPPGLFPGDWDNYAPTQVKHIWRLWGT